MRSGYLFTQGQGQQGRALPDDVQEMIEYTEWSIKNKDGIGKFTYRLAGLTCLAGDVIGDYSFADFRGRGQVLIDLIVDQYFVVLERFGDRIESLEELPAVLTTLRA